MSDVPPLASLLSQLTLEEKASLCLGSDFWHTAAVERLDIPRVMVTDGPHGLRKQPDEGDHVGIGGSVPATCFPTAAGLGSSWNPALAREIGEALGRECLAQEVSVLLGPGINIKRSPLCGRNFEYFSEDPVLAGVMAGAMVQGVQSKGVGTSLKHFAANNQEEDRLRVSADVDERTLREIYFPAFERIVTEAQPWTVMCSYNKVNGVYASQHHWLLTEVLRGEWGFEGLVVSDWGAVADRVAALAAGLDLEMPPNRGVSDARIVAAVRAGELDEAVLDATVTRVLTLVERSGRAQGIGEPFDQQAHHNLARRAACESAVLLKNDGDILPLRPGAGERIAVIGEFARTPRYQGAGSSQVNPTRLDNALDELRVALPEGVTLNFAPGFGLGTDEADDERLSAEATESARAANVVLLFLGLPAHYESEGWDRAHMDLPANQLALLDSVARVNPQIVVVLANGSAVRVSSWERHAKALLECWLAGQAGGGAVSDILLGAASPSGRLAESIPLQLEDNPSFLNFPGDSGHVRYGEGIFVGYRAYDKLRRQVSYPFGHGLSYTTFVYAGLDVAISGSQDTGDLAVSVSCQVTNTGASAGQEVVQLYVGDLEASVTRPVRELKGFAKVALAAGGTATASFELTARDFSYWSTKDRRWVLEPGEFEISAGSSSRDLRLVSKVRIEGTALREPLGPGSTLAEWLGDPAGSAVLLEAVGAEPSGRAKAMFSDGDFVKMVGNFPLDRLAGFPGSGLDQTLLVDLVAKLEE
jgi:beta-glucosidase